MSLGGGLAGASGGKTPFGARTPGRTPAAGHATPGHMSVRQVGRTPNPYGVPGVPPGVPPPAAGFPPAFPGYPGGQQQYGGGFQPPPGYPQPGAPAFGQPPPPGAGPPGIHPSRAAMIQGNGWGAQF